MELAANNAIVASSTVMLGQLMIVWMPFYEYYASADDYINVL